MTERGAGPLTLDALRARFDADAAATRAGSTDPVRERLARALRGIGWRGTDLADAGEVAALLVPVVEACVSEHRSLPALYRDVAEVLRQSGPLLDGSLPPATAYLPAAEELVHRYVADVD